MAPRSRKVLSDSEKRAICARIKRARLDAGMTQEEMAKRLRVKDRTYNNYERDRVPFSLMPQIADIVGRSTEWLLRGMSGTTPELETELERAQTERDEIRAMLELVLEEIRPGWRERIELPGGLLKPQGTPEPHRADGSSDGQDPAKPANGRAAHPDPVAPPGDDEPPHS